MTCYIIPWAVQPVLWIYLCGYIKEVSDAPSLSVETMVFVNQFKAASTEWSHAFDQNGHLLRLNDQIVFIKMATKQYHMIKCCWSEWPLVSTEWSNAFDQNGHLLRLNDQMVLIKMATSWDQNDWMVLIWRGYHWVILRFTVLCDGFKM